MSAQTPPAPDPSAREGDRASDERSAAGPSVLDLVRLSPRPVFPPGGEVLYRQIARLAELEEGQSVLDSGSGRGVATSFLAASYGVEAHGVDSDPELIAVAEKGAKAAGLGDRLHFQCAPATDLPYTDATFDLAIGEIGFAGAGDSAAAVRELVRVTRPMGKVALVQLIWTGSMEESRRETLARHLGARPRLLIEWKQLLRDAGVVELQVEDWSDHASPFRGGAESPFYDLASIFTLRQRLTILRRAMQKWGWRGARGAIVREQEIHRLLTRERVLGLSLVMGTRWPHDDEEEAGQAAA